MELVIFCLTDYNTNTYDLKLFSFHIPPLVEMLIWTGSDFCKLSDNICGLPVDVPSSFLRFTSLTDFEVFSTVVVILFGSPVLPSDFSVLKCTPVFRKTFLCK